MLRKGKKIRKNDEITVNPYMGFAPPADGGPYTQPHSLVFANFTWREIEPKKGFYDFKFLERKFKLDYWKRQNVKLVFRVVLDYPRKSRHIDIPDWLYKEINGGGTWYEHEWGSGFSPNYYNKKLINSHEKLIQALAERFNGDPGIAFIELGSLGHWGEWHTLQQDGIYIPFPKLPVAETYVNHYMHYFDKNILLMRRPHQIAITNRMGLFNDMFGNEDQTIDEFWNWVENGYEFWLTNEQNPSMPDYWKYAPSGGEFAYTQQWEDYFSSSNFPGVLEQLKLTHVSWLGPSSPFDYPVDGILQSRINLFLKKMGYHFRLVRETHPQKVSKGTAFKIDMLWENDGVAPFYFRWPLEVSLADREGEIVHKQLVETDIRRWLPGKHEVSVEITVPTTLSGQYEICVAILDPKNMEPGIQFDMQGKKPDGRYLIGKVIVV